MTVLAKVEIYTKDWCSYCARAKRLLAEVGAEVTEYEIDFDSEKRSEMIQRSSGRTTVPQIFIDGQHVGGCTELVRLHSEGRLVAMLAG